MATSRRRTSKKDIGQNLNELERRARSVERRPSRSFIEKSVIDSASLGEGSVTLGNLDSTLSAIISNNSNTFDTISLASEQLSISLSDTSTTATASFLGADGKTQVYYQSTEPPSDGRVVDDLWYDTNDDYKPYRWGYEEVSITNVVVSGASAPYTAVLTTSADHTLVDSKYIYIIGLDSGTGLNDEIWQISSHTDTTFTITDIPTATAGTYSAQTGTGTSQDGAWFEAPFGDAALASLTVGKLLTGTLQATTSVKVGGPSGTNPYIDINGTSGITFYASDGTTEIVSLDITDGSASFTGTLTAASGSIGGWLISSTYLSKGEVGFNAPTSPLSTDVAIWAGDTYANRTSAEFKVLYNGSLTASSATITGTINASGGYIGGSSSGWVIGSNLLSNGNVGINAPTTTSYSTTATGTSGTATLTLTSATNFVAGQSISGTGIPSGTYITTLVGTTATLSKNLTTSGSRTVTVYDVAFFAGDTYANRYISEFRVDYAGNLRANNAYISGTINATGGNFTGYITAGTLRLGADVSSTNDGIWIDANNYWYDTGVFKVGGSSANVEWDGSDFTITGSLVAGVTTVTGSLTTQNAASDGGKVVITPSTESASDIRIYNNYIPLSGGTYSRTSTTARITTSTPHYLPSGGYVRVVGLTALDDGDQVYLITVPGKVVTNIALSSGTTYTLTTSSAHNFLTNDSVTLSNFPSPYGEFDGTFTITAVPTTTTFRINLGVTGDTGAVDPMSEAYAQLQRVFTYTTSASGTVATTSAPTGSYVTREYGSTGYGFIGTSSIDENVYGPLPGYYPKSPTTVIASPSTYIGTTSAGSRSRIYLYTNGSDSALTEVGSAITLDARYVEIGNFSFSRGSIVLNGYVVSNDSFMALGPSSFVGNASFGTASFSTINGTISFTGDTTFNGDLISDSRFRLPAISAGVTGLQNGDLAFNGTTNTIEVGIGSTVVRYLQPVVRGVESVSPNASGLDAVPTYYTSTANGGQLTNAIAITGAVVDLLNSGGAVRAQVHNLNLGQGGGSQTGSIQVRLVNTTTGSPVTSGTYDLMYVAWV